MIDNVIWLSTLTSDSSLIIIHTGILQSTFSLLWNLVNWLRKGLSVIAESSHGWSVGMAAKKDKGDEQKMAETLTGLHRKGFTCFFLAQIIVIKISVCNYIELWCRPVCLLAICYCVGWNAEQISLMCQNEMTVLFYERTVSFQGGHAYRNGQLLCKNGLTGLLNLYRRRNLHFNWNCCHDITNSA